MNQGNPSVRFSSDKSLLNTWAANLSISTLSEQDMQAAYDRSGKFLREQGNMLVDQHGWSSVHSLTVRVTHHSIIVIYAAQRYNLGCPKFKEYSRRPPRSSGTIQVFSPTWKRSLEEDLLQCQQHFQCPQRFP